MVSAGVQSINQCSVLHALWPHILLFDALLVSVLREGPLRGTWRYLPRRWEMDAGPALLVHFGMTGDWEEAGLEAGAQWAEQGARRREQRVCRRRGSQRSLTRGGAP